MTRVSLNKTKHKLKIWEKNEVQNKRENTKIKMEKRVRKTMQKTLLEQKLI
jgi:phage anti-repressor protein